MKKIMSIVSFLFSLPFILLSIFIKGFLSLTLFFTRGIYFYFCKFFSILYDKSKISFFHTLFLYGREQQERPIQTLFFFLFFFFMIYVFDYFYIDSSYLLVHLPETVERDFSSILKIDKTSSTSIFRKELNLYRYYSHFNSKDISISSLKKNNSDTTSWIMVQDTLINYPVVQGFNNQYYLNHSFDQNSNRNGWIFMDYRNSIFMDDQNTIIYGRNFINDTAFGSLDQLLYQKNVLPRILIITEDTLYTYQIFSIYKSQDIDEIYQVEFSTRSNFYHYLEMISSRSISSFPTSVTSSDKILTLSTIEEQEKERVIVHAKLIQEEKV